MTGDERIRVLTALSEALAAASSIDEVARVVTDQGVAFAGSDTCTLHLLNEQTMALELVAERGCNPAIIAGIKVITAESQNPVYPIGCGRAGTVWIETEEDFRAFHPELAAMQIGGARARSFWCMPLVAENRTIGIIGVGFHTTRRFPLEEREIIATFARQSAQALARAKLLARERAAAALAESLRISLTNTLRGQAFLANAGTLLGESLDYEATVAQVARLAVPDLADWCAVDLAVDGERLPRRLAVAHVDPAKLDLARALWTKYLPNPDATSGVPNVLRTGQAELYPEITDAMLVRSCVDEEHLRICRALQLRSAMIVPLLAHGRVLGAMSFVHAESGKTYNEEELAFAKEVARRCATAIENARSYAAAQSAQRAAEQANSTKDDFLAVVSHELRTPLNAIMGWAKLLSDRREESVDDRAGLETIERNAVAMARLIDDLLDMSRVISGRLRLELRPVDLGAVITAAVDAIRPTAAARSLRLVASLGDDVVRLPADAARLQQVVSNLLSNAVKFTAPGGEVGVALRLIGDEVELVVSDTGRGIAASFLPYVFDQFRQEDATPSRSRGGLGLGLAISKQLVELHGGRISAQSPGEGCGATFRVRLPLSTIANSTPGEGSTESSAIADAHRRVDLRAVRVLAVDDDDDGRELVAEILKRCGCEVSTAGSVSEALEKLTAGAPDVLLSDIAMPQRDGYDLIRCVRALPPERGGSIPAAALTASARPEDRERLLAAGFSLHLAKPIDPSELVRAVSRLLEDSAELSEHKRKPRR